MIFAIISIVASIVAVAASLYLVRRDLHRLAAKAIGFTIIGNGYGKRHYAIRYSEAVAWAACYDDGASIYKGGVLVASKMLTKA